MCPSLHPSALCAGARHVLQPQLRSSDLSPKCSFAQCAPCGRYKLRSRFTVFFELQTAVFLHVVIIIHLFQDTVGLILQSALLLKSVLWEYCRRTDDSSKTQLILLEGRVGQQTRFIFFPCECVCVFPCPMGTCKAVHLGVGCWAVLASLQALWGHVFPCPASLSFILLHYHQASQWKHHPNWFTTITGFALVQVMLSITTTFGLEQVRLLFVVVGNFSSS